MTCGIYRIYNKIDGKSYVGSSYDVDRRFKEHKAALRKSVHVNKHLQRAWNKYGEGAFEFELIMLVDRDNLLQEETVQINLVSEEMSYNIVKNAEAPMAERKHSEETKCKLSRVHTDKWNDAEYKAKMAACHVGKVHSQSSKEKIKHSLQKPLIGDGVVFSSAEEAAFTMRMTVSGVKNRVRRDSWPTWYYIEKGDGREYDDA